MMKKDDISEVVKDIINLQYYMGISESDMCAVLFGIAVEKAQQANIPKYKTFKMISEFYKNGAE